MIYHSTTAAWPPAVTPEAAVCYGRRPTVILIDDDEAVRTSLRRVLLSEGFNVIAVSRDGALRSMELFEPDLIITDLAMTATDGREFLRSTKRLRPSLPLFAIAARSARECGGIDQPADEFFLKPIDLDALISALHRHLGTADTSRNEAMTIIP